MGNQKSRMKQLTTNSRNGVIRKKRTKRFSWRISGFNKEISVPSKSMVRIFHVTINYLFKRYPKLKAFLKCKSTGYRPKKSEVLTRAEIVALLTEA